MTFVLCGLLVEGNPGRQARHEVCPVLANGGDAAGMIAQGPDRSP